MGSLLCSCCSRNKVPLSKNTSDDVRESLLNASGSGTESDKLSPLKSSAQKAPSAGGKGYGSTGAMHYTRLKDKTGTTKILNSDHPTFHSITPNDIIQETHGVEIKHDKNKEDAKDIEEQHIPINTHNVMVAAAGYDEINGPYRWFPHHSKWCLFTENASYILDKEVKAEEVYTQLTRLQSAEANFRWGDDIKQCWVISTMDKSAIYYAAPVTKQYRDYIPNQSDWISVHGSLPAPDIFANLMDGSLPPDKVEEIANISPKLSWVKQRSHGSSVSSLQPITETDKLGRSMENMDLNDEKEEEEEEKDYNAMMDDEDDDGNESSLSDLRVS